MSVVALVPAAGYFRRMGQKKEFLSLGDRPVLAHVLQVLESYPRICDIILIIDRRNLKFCQNEIVRRRKFSKVRELVIGGPRRQDSVYNGLVRVRGDCDIVLIQDGDRPFLTEDMIANSIEEAIKYGACIYAVPAVDTVKLAQKGKGFVAETLERAKLWLAQTPQTFKYGLILDAHKRAHEDKFEATDDASLVERMGHRVKIIEGSYENIKITTPQDLALAELILKRREGKTVNLLKSV
jgi:2-C-methyl-D-erythritol 4-phosphate cytidylyltransferase